MFDEEKKKDELSDQSSINTIKNNIQNELARLKELITGGYNNYNDINKGDESYFPIKSKNNLPRNQEGEPESTTISGAPGTSGLDISESKSLSNKIKVLLIKHASEIYYEILSAPEFKKQSEIFLASLEKKIKEQFNIQFPSENDSPNEFINDMEEEYLKLRDGFFDPIELRDQSIIFANIHYNTADDYLYIFNQIPEILRTSLKKSMKGFLKKGSKIFKIKKRILSNLNSIAKKKNLEAVIKAQYQILKELFPEKQDYITFMWDGYYINNEFVYVLEQLLDNDDEAKSEHQIIFETLSARNESVVKKFIRIEAEKIYTT